VGIGFGFESGFMTDDERRSSSSLSRREVDVIEADIGEVARGLKYDGAVEGVDSVEADADVDACEEAEAEESNGGGEIEIAEAIDWDMSDRRREARFWLLENLDPGTEVSRKEKEEGDKDIRGSTL
jgi:hypothetical protein